MSGDGLLAAALAVLTAVLWWVLRAAQAGTLSPGALSGALSFSRAEQAMRSTGWRTDA